MPERYEREIDEIIKRKGEDLGPRTPLRQAFADLQRRTRDNLRKQTPLFFRVVTPRRVGTVGVVLLLGAFLAKTSYLAVLSVTVLLAAYVLSVARGPVENEQRWRGPPIDLRSRPNFFSRIKGWFGKKPRA